MKMNKTGLDRTAATMYVADRILKAHAAKRNCRFKIVERLADGSATTYQVAFVVDKEKDRFDLESKEVNGHYPLKEPNPGPSIEELVEAFEEWIPGLELELSLYFLKDPTHERELIFEEVYDTFFRYSKDATYDIL